MTTTQLSAARSATTMLVVSAAAFLASLDLFIVNIAFPDIRKAFGTADLGAMSWILNGYTLVFAAFMTPAGRLGDRYGHRQIFLWGLAVFTLGSAACGLSGSFAMLVAFRVVQAFGAAMLMPSSLALLLAAVPASRRAVAVSTWSAVGAMAAALGPPLGGMLVELSWRWIFFVNVPAGIAGPCRGPLGARQNPPRRRGASRSIRCAVPGARYRRLGVGPDRTARSFQWREGRDRHSGCRMRDGAGHMAFVTPSLAGTGSRRRAGAADVVELPRAAAVCRGVRCDAAEQRHAAHHRVGRNPQKSPACSCRRVPLS